HPRSTPFPYTTLFRSWTSSPATSAFPRPKETYPDQFEGLFAPRESDQRIAAAHREARAIRRAFFWTAPPWGSYPCWPAQAARERSEEHTSELQSRFDL